jgi:hypothetical protein
MTFRSHCYTIVYHSPTPVFVAHHWLKKLCSRHRNQKIGLGRWRFRGQLNSLYNWLAGRCLTHISPTSPLLLNIGLAKTNYIAARSGGQRDVLEHAARDGDAVAHCAVTARPRVRSRPPRPVERQRPNVVSFAPTRPGQRVCRGARRQGQFSPCASLVLLRHDLHLPSVVQRP